ncbi:MAG: AsmA family protein [Gallionella sp.]|nr:AsmA family protein [Gallionella sp.]
MNKILKTGLITTASVVGVAVAGAAYLAATFDPNAYKAQIIKAVQDSKHRTLHLDGDISLSFFPNIGVNLSKVALSEANSDKEFAALNSARVSLALLPLFSKQIVVNEVSLNGVRATVIKHKDGTSNIDDLVAKSTDTQAAPASQSVKLDIAKVVVADTAFSYQDEQTGAHYDIKDLQLESSRIANGVPAKISMSVLVQGNQPKVALKTELKTTLTFDIDKQSYQLAGLDIKVTGEVLDITQLQVQASGDASADLKTREFFAKQLAVKVSGVQGKQSFSADLSAPDLNLSNDHYTGTKLVLNANLEAAFGKLIASLSIPSISGSAQAFKIDDVLLNAQLEQADQTFKVKLNTPLAGNMVSQQFDLSNLNIDMSATGDKLPNKSISSTMKGNVQLNTKKQIVQANLSGGLLQSQLRAKLGVKGFAQPSIYFDVDVDQLDADLYLPKKTAETAAPTNSPEQPLDLSALRTLNLDGSLRIGSLKAANVKVKQLRIDVQAHKGIVNVSPLSAELYQGSTSGSININAQATPAIVIKQTLTGVDIAPLGKDAANFDTLEGHGNIALNISMQGDKVSEMKRAMNGTASLSLVDGAIKGINVAKKMRGVKSMFGAKSDIQTADKAEKTDFSELKASFKITNGVAHNDDLSMKSPLLRLSGAGDINIGNDSIDYLAKATLAKTLEGQGGADAVGGLTVPLRVHGPFTDMKYSLEFGAMVSDGAKQKVTAQVDAAKAAAQQKLDAEKAAAKSKLQDQLKGGLKGLFK